MKKHTKIYMEEFDYCIEDFIPCEIESCNKRAESVHHIYNRGMGGSKHKDYIENLMALCMECHLKYGDKREYINFLKSTHLRKMLNG